MEQTTVKGIETLLKQRDDLFANQTKVIFERIEPTLAGIREFLTTADPSYVPSEFTWVDVYTSEESLILIGVAQYPDGASFTLDGQLIEITENNKEHFSRPLRFGFPLATVNEHSQEAIVDFLNTLKASIEEEHARILAEDAQLILDEDGFDFEEDITLKPDSTELEFDLDDLTEDQRKALLLHDTTEKIN